MIEDDRLIQAYETARADLLAECEPTGHWVGELSTSALSTATAVSALSLVKRHAKMDSWGEGGPQEKRLSDLVSGGIEWLAARQNADGGWGDTQKSYSNISTTMLVQAAFRLAPISRPKTSGATGCLSASVSVSGENTAGQASSGTHLAYESLLQRADAYVQSQGNIGGLKRRYGKDKTFAVPILTNCALAGLVDWSEVSPLPFELACVPRRLFKWMNLNVVSYAIPALVAIGQARYFHKKPVNPVTRLIRKMAIGKSLELLGKMLPESGGFLEAVPLTSFVVMSLAATGRANHPVVRQGTKFIMDSVRADGSWPIDTNLATWNTTLAINALSFSDDFCEKTDRLTWLLDCQHKKVHPYTGAEPGGWAWTDLSGGVPDVDDTSGAMLALAEIHDAKNSHLDSARRETIRDAASLGAQWLLSVQNRDGGWPTFCAGWGKLPFDRSGADLTAHAMRALFRWSDLAANAKNRTSPDRIRTAIDQGFAFLTKSQRSDGSWVPLWFGNQDHEGEENPIYGTSRVLLAYCELKKANRPEAIAAIKYLCNRQNGDGGWTSATTGGPQEVDCLPPSIVEETALALDALICFSQNDGMEQVIERGLSWLCQTVGENRHRDPSPIGFYFAKLWYYERLYPLTFSISALGRAVRERRLPSRSKPTAAHQS